MLIDRKASEEAVACCMAYAKMEIADRGLDLKSMYSVDLYGHCEHVAKLALVLGSAYQFNLNELVQLGMGGLLHDIGKCEITDKIIKKPSRLDDEEYQLVQSHPSIGHRILKPYGFSADVMDMVLYHHERLDGSGYPTGNYDISIYVQIIAVADMFDAIYCECVYHGKRTMEEALSIMETTEGLNKIALDILKSLPYSG